MNKKNRISKYQSFVLRTESAMKALGGLYELFPSSSSPWFNTLHAAMIFDVYNNGKGNGNPPRTEDIAAETGFTIDYTQKTIDAIAGSLQALADTLGYDLIKKEE